MRAHSILEILTQLTDSFADTKSDNIGVKIFVDYREVGRTGIIKI
jgi:hypothetical protein